MVEGSMLLLLRRRRAVGMDIHDAGAGVRESASMNWLALACVEVGLLSQWRGETGAVGMGRGGGGSRGGYRRRVW